MRSIRYDAIAVREKTTERAESCASCELHRTFAGFHVLGVSLKPINSIETKIEDPRKEMRSVSPARGVYGAVKVAAEEAWRMRMRSGRAGEKGQRQGLNGVPCMHLKLFRFFYKSLHRLAFYLEGL